MTRPIISKAVPAKVPRKKTQPSASHHIAFTAPGTVHVAMRCGATDTERGTWTFDVRKYDGGCPGCLAWRDAMANARMDPLALCVRDLAEARKQLDEAVGLLRRLVDDGPSVISARAYLARLDSEKKEGT